MSKKALVAGGAGFIGSHLCEFLMGKDYTVHAIDSLITGHRSNIQHLIERGLNWLDADINTDFYLNGTYDEIYNLASPASPVDFEKMPTFILETAARGHRNLLKHAQTMKAKILFASTSEVYGDPLEHPQREDYRGNVSTTGPRSCYDEGKRLGESLSMAFHREFKVDIRIARIFNTYGPRLRPEDGRVVPNFFLQALNKKALTVYGDGSQTRSLCFVTDLVEGIYALMQSHEIRPVNLGNPHEMTVLELANRINEITGNTAGVTHKTLPKDDPLRRKPDISRAREVLKWEPRVSLEKGLELTHHFFKHL